MSLLKCPECHTSDVKKLKGQCATCLTCSKAQQRVYRFCWACQREWPSNYPFDATCNLSHCALRAALLSPTRISSSNIAVNGCPYFRACPNCKALLTHNANGCPRITCPNCNTQFCFRCLHPECFGRILSPRQLPRHINMITVFNQMMEQCAIVDNSQSLSKLEQCK